MLDTSGDSYEKYELLNDLEKGSCLYQMKECQLLFIEEIARLIQALYMPIKGFKGHNVIDYVKIETNQKKFDRFTYDVLNDQVKNGYENTLELSFNFLDDEIIPIRYCYSIKKLQFLDKDQEIWCNAFNDKFFELGLYIIEQYDFYRDSFY